MSTLNALSDDELSLLLFQGEESAFVAIYDRYKLVLYQHVYKILRNQQEADDIIQELFTSLWIKRKALQIKSNLSGYLYTSVRNRVIDFLAKQKVKSTYLTKLQQFIDHGMAVTDHRVRLSMLHAVIEKEIAHLPEKMREVFELSRKKQLTNREIAVQLDISEKTVKNQINNALKILRTRIGPLVYIYFLLQSK